MTANPKDVVDRLEITPEMIVAATRVLWASGIVSHKAEGADELIVGEMLHVALTLTDSGAATLRAGLLKR
jgi:hypothetical protein